MAAAAFDSVIVDDEFRPSLAAQNAQQYRMNRSSHARSVVLVRGLKYGLQFGLASVLIGSLVYGPLITLLRAQAADEEQCFVNEKLVETPAAIALAGQSGVMRCTRTSTAARVRELEFVAGRLARQSEWNELGQRLDTSFYANGAAKTRARQVMFDGGPAWDREEFWASGLLRLRGTYIQGEGAQGLVQIFHEEGPLASEVWYDRGRVLRRKRFALDGRQTADEEYLADGEVKSLMQRF